MKKLIQKLLFILLVFAFPIISSAAGFTENYDKLLNPIPTNEFYCPTAVCEIKSFFLLIIRNILQIIPVFSVLMIIIGGFKMVMSAGNEERYAEAKRTIAWAVLGLVVAVMSFSIIAIVQNLLQSNV